MAKHSKEVRDKIIENASGLFARFGLFKTTIDDIARSLHMGKSSLYYYFKNKEELFKVVIQQEAENMSSQVKTAVERAAAPDEQLRVFATVRMRCFKEFTNIYSALRDDYLNAYGFIQEIRLSYDQRELALVKKILQGGVEKKVFAIRDPELTAKAIITALKGFEYEWSFKSGGINVNIEENIVKLHNMLLYGIMKK